MSWVLLDDDFPHHPKTVAVGNDGVALFVLGLCYCRKYHTGGFISVEACKRLGFKGNPRRTIEALIGVGYWERAEGGFQIHEYGVRYDDQKAKATKEKRREAGRKGGIESGRSRNEKNEANASTVASPPNVVVLQPLRDGQDSDAPVDLQEKRDRREPDDEPGQSKIADWWQEVLKIYPQNRVMHNFMTQSIFSQIFEEDHRPKFEVWEEFRSKLEHNKRSHEWRVKGMVPKLENYLRHGWRQVHDELPVSVRVNDKTARTMASAAAFAAGEDA